MDLREHARGRPCMVRIPGVCNFNDETTVLAHIRMPGVTGMGMKAPDLFAAWACSACHDEIDRRTHHHDYETVRISFLEAVIRTQAELIAEGVLHW